jgi:catechol 2,3-dioxygenase
MAKPAPAFSHMGIFTDNPQAMTDFYVRVLRLVVSDSGRGNVFDRQIIFMTGDASQHHQFVLVVRAPGDPPGGALFQVSFKLQSLDELRETTRRALAHGAVGLRSINHGNSWSVYFRDPDGNQVEIYMDTGWHVPQPFADELPLERSDGEIRAVTEARVRSVAGTQEHAEWSGKLRRALDERRDAID